MSQILVSEKEVKEALNIDSFRNLSKDKVMEFVSLIPNIDKDVALSIINQFPAYSEMAKCMVEQLSKTCDTILDNNAESQNSVYSAYKKILDDLGEILKREDITAEEREKITRNMIEIADKMSEKDSENKKYLSWVVKNKEYVIATAILIGGTILGVKIKGKLPKIKK